MLISHSRLYNIHFHRSLSNTLILSYNLLCASFLVLTLLGYERRSVGDFPWKYITYPIPSIDILLGPMIIVGTLKDGLEPMMFITEYRCRIK